jgi:hypothetical protein
MCQLYCIWQRLISETGNAITGIQREVPFMEAKLAVVAGNTSKSEIRLQLPTTIGRGTGSGLCIAHPMISRRHCELSEQDGLLMLRDLDSLNGTFLGQQRISEAALRPGDRFTVGPITFRAEYEYDGDLSAIPPPKLASPAVQGKAGAQAGSLIEKAGSVSATSAGTPVRASVEEVADDDLVSFPLEEEVPKAPPAAARKADAPKAAAKKPADDEDDLIFQVLNDEPEEKPKKAAQPAPAAKKKPDALAARKQPVGAGNDKHAAAVGPAKKPGAGAQTVAHKPPAAKPGPQKATPKPGQKQPARAPAKPAAPQIDDEDSSEEPIDQAFEDFLKGVE